jgi:putative ABC transport system permease protein
MMSLHLKYLIDAIADARRLLRARPLGNAMVVLVLASGLAAVIAVSALAHLIANNAPAGVPAEKLFIVGNGFGPSSGLTLTGGEALSLRRELPGLARTALLRWNDFNVGGSGEQAEQASGLLVDGDPFALLGWPMAFGRGFVDSDFAPDAAPAVIIGDRLWRSRFGADPGLIGRSIRLDGTPVTVVGVLPPRRAYPFQQQIYRAVHLAADERQMARPWQTLSRIDDADSLGATRAALAALQGEREQREGQAAVQSPLRIEPVWSSEMEPATYALMLVLGVVVGLVMLLAASNAGGLLLVQWLGRARELATRAALGASAGRVLASLLGQGLLLGLLAWVLALLGASWLLAWFGDYLRSVPNGMPLYAELGIQPAVLGLSAAVMLLVVLALSYPTWRRLRRGELALELRSGTRSVAGGLSRGGRVLFGLQALLAVVTVLATLQALEGTHAQLNRPMGLETANVLVGQFSGTDVEAKARFARRLRERLAAEPGIEAVSVSASIPGALTTYRTLSLGEQRVSVDFAPVDLAYRAVYGLGLRQGRWFSAQEIDESRDVAVLDATLADALFAGEPAIGRSFTLHESGGTREMEVVGVSEVVRLTQRGGADQPSLFAPLPPAPVYELAVSARTAAAAEVFAPRLRSIAAEIDPDIALAEVGSFAELRWRSNAWTRMVLGMFAPMGALALLLTAAGLAALVGTLVSLRVREIGLRRALGAKPGQLLGSLIGGLARWGGIGTVAGIGLAIALLGPLGQTLYGESQVGLASVLGSFVALLGALALAVAAPLRRALRIEPTEALREE